MLLECVTLVASNNIFLSFPFIYIEQKIIFAVTDKIIFRVNKGAAATKVQGDILTYFNFGNKNIAINYIKIISAVLRK